MKSIISKIALCLFGVFVALAIGESLARYLGYTSTGDRLSAYDFDPILGWKTKTSYTSFRSAVSYAHFNYYDRDGLPCLRKKILDSRFGESNSIALFGDSYAESYYLPYEKSFPNLLETQLHRPILNFGVSGYSPDQYLLRARSVLPQTHATQVIVTFFPNNDISDLDRPEYQGYAKPLFIDPLGEPSNLPLQKLEGKEDDRNLFRRIFSHSALYSLLRPLIKRLTGVPGLSEKVALRYPRDGMEKALLLIARIQKEFSIQHFLVLYIPRVEEIMDEDSFFQNTLDFHQICDQLMLSCLDFKPVLATINDPRKLYIPGDGHLSELGAERVASYLAQSIEK